MQTIDYAVAVELREADRLLWDLHLRVGRERIASGDENLALLQRACDRIDEAWALLGGEVDSRGGFKLPANPDLAFDAAGEVADRGHHVYREERT